jgi:hypothetical protein
MPTTAAPTSVAWVAPTAVPTVTSDSSGRTGVDVGGLNAGSATGSDSSSSAADKLLTVVWPLYVLAVVLAICTYYKCHKSWCRYRERRVGKANGTLSGQKVQQAGGNNEKSEKGRVPHANEKMRVGGGEAWGGAGDGKRAGKGGAHGRTKKTNKGVVVGKRRGSSRQARGEMKGEVKREATGGGYIIGNAPLQVAHRKNGSAGKRSRHGKVEEANVAGVESRIGRRAAGIGQSAAGTGQSAAGIGQSAAGQSAAGWGVIRSALADNTLLEHSRVELSAIRAVHHIDQAKALRSSNDALLRDQATAPHRSHASVGGMGGIHRSVNGSFLKSHPSPPSMASPNLSQIETSVSMHRAAARDTMPIGSGGGSRRRNEPIGEASRRAEGSSSKEASAVAAAAADTPMGFSELAAQLGVVGLREGRRRPRREAQ